ncbi:hypothetical protein [Desulfopila sp. IMCC35008]|uniref:hypothetical protein n=1 Tax=Desulfopila sp. IMCC35008 TaxID=2653858 RepID=UPI0013D7D060|nr:hypothetical protein [Desulfopila sp. IMCC35008]
MIMDYHYTLYKDHLEVQICGNFVIQEAINKFSILLEYCRDTDCRKVLIDYSQVSNMPSGTLRHLYQFSIEDKYSRYMLEFNKSISFASIHTILTAERTDTKNDTLLFSMRNRSFKTLEEARNWLKVKSDQ